MKKISPSAIYHQGPQREINTTKPPPSAGRVVVVAKMKVKYTDSILGYCNKFMCTYKIEVPIFDPGYGNYLLNITTLHFHNKSGTSLKFSLYVFCRPCEAVKKTFLRLYERESADKNLFKIVVFLKILNLLSLPNFLFRFRSQY